MGFLVVKFSVLGEFMKELRLCFERIEGKVIRSTFTFRRSYNGPVQEVAFVCSCRVDETILKLQEPMGELWGIGEDVDHRTKQKMDDSMKTIKTFANDVGLDVRAGILEVA